MQDTKLKTASVVGTFEKKLDDQPRTSALYSPWRLLEAYRWHQPQEMWLAHAYTICLKTINLQPNGGLPSDSIPFHESTRPKCMDRLVGACIPVSQPRRWCCKPKAACLRSSRTNKRDPFEGAVRMSGCKRPFFGPIWISGDHMFQGKCRWYIQVSAGLINRSLIV